MHRSVSFTELFIQEWYIVYCVVNRREYAKGEIHVRKTDKYVHVLVLHRDTYIHRDGEWFVQSVARRMNRQESTEGDVVKREDGVARAFGFNLYQPAAYLGILLAFKLFFLNLYLASTFSACFCFLFLPLFIITILVIILFTILIIIIVVIFFPFLDPPSLLER